MVYENFLVDTSLLTLIIIPRIISSKPAHSFVTRLSNCHTNSFMCRLLALSKILLIHISCPSPFLISILIFFFRYRHTRLTCNAIGVCLFFDNIPCRSRDSFGLACLSQFSDLTHFSLVSYNHTSSFSGGSARSYFLPFASS